MKKLLVVALLFWCPALLAEAQMCPDGTLKLFNPTCGKGQAGEKFVPAPGCEELFGPEPRSKDFANYRLFQGARDLYNQNIRQCSATGRPEWATQGELDLATGVLVHWGLGAPKFYKGKYGWMARFPDAKFDIAFEAAAWATIFRTHQIVSAWQIDAATDGFGITNCHPFTPPRYCKSDTASLYRLDARDELSYPTVLVKVGDSP